MEMTTKELAFAVWNEIVKTYGAETAQDKVRKYIKASVENGYSHSRRERNFCRELETLSMA